MKLPFGIGRLSQQTIVFTIFVLMFGGFGLFLPGFLTAGNLLGLLQNVAILGILGLAMAIIVIGRGIDISMVAVLAVPAGLVLQLVQDGHSVPMAFVAALALALAFGLVNGWLVAYAEVPSLFTTLASGLFLAGLGQVAFFRLDIVQWSPQLDPLSWVGRGTLLGVPMPVVMFGAWPRWCVLPAPHAPGHLRLRGRRQPLRRPRHRHSDAPGDRAAVRARGADRHVRGHGDGRLGQQHAHTDLQLDPDLRRDPRRRARRHRPVGRAGRRASTSSSAPC